MEGQKLDILNTELLNSRYNRAGIGFRFRFESCSEKSILFHIFVVPSRPRSYSVVYGVICCTGP